MSKSIVNPPISYHQKFKKILDVRTKAFMHAVKIGTFFVVYVTPTANATTTTTVLSKQYEVYKDVFEKKNADILPQHRPYNCTIDLEKGAQPLFGSIYNLLQDKFIELKQYIDENLTKNFIQHSKSTVGVPILFVRKNDRSLRMYIDYQGLNKVIIKNQ